MTIRAKLTIWYAVILFASLLLITGLAYDELVLEKPAKAGGDAPKTSKAFNELEEIVVLFGLPAALLGLAGGW